MTKESATLYWLIDKHSCRNHNLIIIDQKRKKKQHILQLCSYFLIRRYFLQDLFI